MKRIWSSVDRWGPGVVALVALLIALWYGRFLEGAILGLCEQASARIQIEGMLRIEIQTWQAYTVSLQKLMIEHGIKVPDVPQPVQVHAGKRIRITTRDQEREQKK